VLRRLRRSTEQSDAPIGPELLLVISELADLAAGEETTLEVIAREGPAVEVRLVAATAKLERLAGSAPGSLDGESQGQPVTARELGWASGASGCSGPRWMAGAAALQLL